ncbi:DNA replication licensing factor mcm7-B [Tritrichomonas foetus]|uniref:DNA replication licensing factor MCM7 n=1 Tax=Tritrichomonas foetus TaxID=1144522 RepID=A0A1J4JEM4_9EUKA|nr:DNA replication licensing factor mcm7-B [Tritrichomonas foetus]|eukprot:OHS96091.1 DNA replication licensing factor mcm7-B [Tritrichomonas foetus]
MKDSGKQALNWNYKEDAVKIKEFLEKYQGDDQEAKYRAAIDEVAQRRSDELCIDLDDVHDFSADLCDRIQRNTQRYIRLFYSAVDDIIPEQTLDFETTLDAINAVRQSAMRDTSNEKNFPPDLFRHHSIRFIPPSKTPVVPMRNVRANDIGSLVRLKGLVTRITQVKPLIRIAAYTCSQCAEETFQVVDNPTFLPRTVCQSSQCKSSPRPGTLTLQTRGSKFSKFQMIRIQELSSEVPAGHIPHALTVYARDTLTQKCNTGDVIEIDGIFLPMPMRGYKQSLVNETYIEAQNIRVASKCDEIDEGEGEELNDNEEGIYEKLASAVAPEIYGHEDVKRSILLQLVGGLTKTFSDNVKIRGDINICLMGDPGVAKSQLLKWVSRVAPRAVYTTGRGSSGVGLTAAVLKDPVTGEMALEGGALVLSDMGICCIDEFDKMEDTDRTAIYEVMEQQTVSIAKAGITTTLNARTAILAAANPMYSRYNVKKSLLENVNLPAALLSRFDLLFLLLDKPRVESDTALANHIAFVHKNRIAPSTENINLRALRARIEKAKRIEPVIPPDLSKYIAHAYVSMRQENDKEPITTRALLAVIRFSMALARLRLSDEVSQEDVDEALRLVKASKESIELADKEGDKHVNVVSLIYEKINELTSEKGTVSMNEIRNVIRSSGFQEDDLKRTIKEYVTLGIWQLNPSETKLTVVNQA